MLHLLQLSKWTARLVFQIKVHYYEAISCFLSLDGLKKKCNIPLFCFLGNTLTPAVEGSRCKVKRQGVGGRGW